MTLSWKQLCAALAALAVLAGCGHPPPPPPDSDAGTITCENDPRVVPFEAGLTRASEDREVQVKLVSASPSPPTRGANSWNVQVLDKSGAPISGATIEVQPFMPDHGHGSSTQPTVTQGSDGAYEIDGIDYFMPGVWRTRFSIDQAGKTELVDFFFCIPG